MKIDPPVVVVVSAGNSHARLRAAVQVISHPGGQAHFLKLALSVIPEQEVRPFIIGDHDIRVAIVVVVAANGPHSLALVPADT